MILIFDKESMRPGCVNIQAAMGGNVPRHLFHEYFPSEYWQVSIPPTMKAYTVTAEELPTISKLMQLTRHLVC